MSQSIEFVSTYFTEEKIESLFFLLIGISSILLALIFLFIIKYSLYKGLAYPLLLIGILQVVVGISIYIRSPKDIIRVGQLIQNEPQNIQSNEIIRIDQVIDNFTTYLCIEMSLIIISLSLYIYFYKSPQTFWKGVALGLLIQASLLLPLDLVAKQRAHSYHDALIYFVQKQ